MAGENNISVQKKKLKADPFGTISHTAGQSLVCRDTAECPWWAKTVARHLASREARALIVLNSLAGIPKLRDWNGRQLHREWLEGLPMQEARPREPAYFRQALSLLRKMHRQRIAHNDLAKEANCLVLSNGQPAFIDFQMSLHAPGRGFLFRQLAREDLRHLLKHKAYYCPDQLTARERHIIANPSVGAKLWTKLYKPVYLWFTRSILGWPEREGANERVYKDPH